MCVRSRCTLNGQCSSTQIDMIWYLNTAVEASSYVLIYTDLNSPKILKLHEYR